MKKTLLYLCVFCCAIIISCKKGKEVKEDNPLGANYPVGLSKVITSTIIDSLQKRGVAVNSGLTPPIINGIYYLSPNVCVYDNAWTKSAGKTFIPYKLQFSNQQGKSIAYAYKSTSPTSPDTGSDANAFITGSGNAFTVYAQVFGGTDSASYTNLFVISGTVKNGIIYNLKQVQYLTAKTDRFNRLVSIGTMRIYADKDSTTGNLSTFSIKEQKEPQTESLLVPSFKGNRSSISLF